MDLEISRKKLSESLYATLSSASLRKIVFSKPRNPGILRAVGTLFEKKGEAYLQIETFHSDGKATHENLALSKDTLPDTCAMLAERALSLFAQTNILTLQGEGAVLLSKKGKITLQGMQHLAPSDSSTQRTVLASHNKEKHYLLQDKEAFAFLAKLGVCDENGRIFDKKRAKYRQINRFLEILDDVYPKLPPEGILQICDLCCGKSYLTFAVYYYLVHIKKRLVRLYGVDRKADVIHFCQETAKSLSFDGMEFYDMDILRFTPEVPPHLVISLHACDIATDIVLATAIRLKAKIILSTPCCHHEMMKQLDAPSLAFLTQHSILKQKFCDAATDALRAKRLEAEGYEVTAMELIDPEETPKNVMIRGILKPTDERHRKRAMEEYLAACRFLRVTPMLQALLSDDSSRNEQKGTELTYETLF